MNNVIKFPRKKKSIRENISDGIITDEVRAVLLKESEELEKHHPNSWDKKFVKDLLTSRCVLSENQIKQLERILGGRLFPDEDIDDFKI